MSPLRFYMAGSGNWRSLFPNEDAITLYHNLYTTSAQISDLTPTEKTQLELWQSAQIITLENGFGVPLTPIFTDTDNVILENWFHELGTQSVGIVKPYIGQYNDLAQQFSKEGHTNPDHLLTLLMCAYTLDVGTLLQLEADLIGEPPLRDTTGNYFLWGETAQRDLSHYFGVNSYRLINFNLSMMWSPAIQRQIPPQLSINLPIFTPESLRVIKELCDEVSQQLAEAFAGHLEALVTPLANCSFRTCSLNDIYCMLFHIGYGLVADALIEANLMSDFPAVADDSWGIWLWSEDG